MSIVGLIILPTSPNRTASLSAPLISHLSHKYPAEAHHEYHVDHRLFVNTSSLLPGTDIKQRQYTQFVTTSHDPESTYVVNSNPSTKVPTTITIPAAAQDSFCQLLLSKLQPQWAPRQSLLLDGVGLRLPIIDDGDWRINIGDLRVSGGVSRSGGAGTTGGIRGALIELEYSDKNTIDVNLMEPDVLKKYDRLFRGFLKATLHEAGDHQFDEPRLLLRKIERQTSKHDDNVHEETKSRETGLAELYSELLRGGKG